MAVEEDFAGYSLALWALLQWRASSGRYIFLSLVLAFAVLFGCSFPCLPISHPALSSIQTQFTEDGSGAPKRVILDPT